MAGAATELPEAFVPASIDRFRFVSRELTPGGEVTLTYALDDLIFNERLALPLERPLSSERLARVQGLLSLLHWVAGVSYYKAALPDQVACESGAPPPAAAALLEALYSEGLGELAFRNGVPLPQPAFPSEGVPSSSARDPQRSGRVLVPVGGGKDSAVAIEVVRAAGADVTLFSLGDAEPIARTAAAAALPRLLASRTLDPRLLALNERGALNGHIPITAIVSCVAMLVAELNGFDAVAMANERSASSPNIAWDGAEVNHQFSKSRRAEHLLAAAFAQGGAAASYFSVLRPASELAIARAFAGLERYHAAFTSCNAIFRIDPLLRASSWCRDCPKCRFVFLVLAPFMDPAALSAIFGADLLADERQYEGFALLTATGGHKPFECVGEERESLAAIALLADDPRWREHAVVRRLAEEVLASAEPDPGRLEDVLALSADHDVPDAMLASLDALLRA